MGYNHRDVAGRTRDVSWTDVQPARAIIAGHVDAVAESLVSVLAGLSDAALQEALDKREVALILRTGYARGHAALARPDEPSTAFDPANNFSDTRKCEVMAKILAHENSQDHRRQRDEEEGHASARTRVGQCPRGS